MRNLILRRANDWGFDFDNGFNSFFRLNETNRLMKTDIKESKDNYTLELELPGYDKTNIDLSIDNGYLTVKAEYTQENNQEDVKLIRRERRYGSASRSFYVGELQQDEVDAKFDNGILSITFPKESKAKKEERKKIDIK